MSSSDTYPTVGIVRSGAGRPMRKRAMIVMPTFLLATVFTFAGAPIAMADPAVAQNSIVAVWQPDHCRRGETPGVCPYSLSQLNTQNTTSPDQQTTTNQSHLPQR
jgi:hypothetical protein